MLMERNREAVSLFKELTVLGDKLMSTSRHISPRSFTGMLTAVVLLLGMSSLSSAATLPDASVIQAAIDKAYKDYKGLEEGAVADYIPALAKVDPNV